MAKDKSQTKFGPSINAPFENGTWKCKITRDGKTIGEGESFNKEEAEKLASERADEYDEDDE